MIGPDRRLFSRPMMVQIPSMGFESTTTRMQQCGWEFSADQDIRSLRLHLAARHQQAQAFLHCSVALDYMKAHHDPSYLSSVGIMFGPVMSRLTVQYHGRAEGSFFDSFEPVDMAPRYETYDAHSLDQYRIFAGMAARTNEIIVEERDVGDLLKMILEKQEPGRQDYFKNQLKANRDGMAVESLPQMKFHAQILSVA